MKRFLLKLSVLFFLIILIQCKFNSEKDMVKHYINKQAKETQKEFYNSTYFASGYSSWLNSNTCNQKNDTFTCICTEGCNHKKIIGNTIEEKEECECYEKRQCYELNEKTQEWEETETDSYEKKWDGELDQCKRK